MTSATKVVKKALDALENVVMAAAVLALGVIVLTVVWQVLARYVTSQSTAWAPELAQTAFVWAALLAIPLGTRSGRHMLVDIWRGRSETVQKVMFTLASVAVMLICLTLVVYGIEMLHTSSQRKLKVILCCISKIYQIIFSIIKSYAKSNRRILLGCIFTDNIMNLVFLFFKFF